MWSHCVPYKVECCLRTRREPVYCVNCHLSAMTSDHGQLPPNIYSTCAKLSPQTRNKINNTKSITELLKADRVYLAPVPQKLCRHSHYICILTFIAADIFIFPMFYYTGRVVFFFICISINITSGPPTAGRRCCCLHSCIQNLAILLSRIDWTARTAC